MSIQASCGHVLTEDEGCGCPVMYPSESGDCWPTVTYATFCLKCRNEWAADGVLFETEDDADVWLDREFRAECAKRDSAQTRQRTQNGNKDTQKPKSGGAEKPKKRDIGREILDGLQECKEMAGKTELSGHSDSDRQKCAHTWLHITPGLGDAYTQCQNCGEYLDE